MTDIEPAVIAAADVGNSRIKIGLYAPDALANLPANMLPEPLRTFDLLPDTEGLANLAGWLAPYQPHDLAWWLGSVERTFATQLVEWLRAGNVHRMVMLSSSDLPLVVSLPQPDRVGIDRLLDALAANRVRPPGRPAILVDLGTAITVDLVSVAGVFLGGAILPGIGMAARALHEFTDLLPLLDMKTLDEPPPALGTATVEAMQSGIYWGAVGGIRCLIEELSSAVGGCPQVYLTGGAAPSVAHLIAPEAGYLPHLTLAGIALAARRS
jgi:type III pantothenate kinase